MSVKKLKLYKSHIRSTQFVFGNQPAQTSNDPNFRPQRSPINGKVAHFVDGKYRTDNVFEIEQLDHEVAAGHPSIYIDPNESEIEIDANDPLAGLKQKWMAEAEAKIRTELLAAQNPANDAGTYTPPDVKPQGTDQLDAMGLTDAQKLERMREKATQLVQKTPEQKVDSVAGINLKNL